MKSFSILLVDDHALMREGLRSIIEKDAAFQIVGEATSGLEAVKMSRALHPDVVIMDIVMRDMNGIEATRDIHRDDPEVAIVALSNHGDSRYVSAMLEAGALGYVVKADAYSELMRAVHAALAGKRYVCPSAAESVPAFCEALESRPRASVYDILGARERQVLQLVADGRSSPEIAERLCISPSTVETHRRNLMRKLGIRNVAELTKYAIREGLTDVDT